jgi:lipid II isoglutaminyl synthase (glutamine-hydrolysing)
MRLYDSLTLAVCKLVYIVMRMTRRHGAAMPGLILERINPGILKRTLGRLPHGVVVISGTNGKTTTTHITSEVYRKKGYRVFTNHSGSNMTRGILSSIVRFARVNGVLEYDIAILEIDEAYAARLAPILKPRASILLNVLRDQLDRFGEIDHTAQLLGELAAHTQNIVVVNAADRRLMREVQNISARVVTFGPAVDILGYFPSDDDWHSTSKKVAKVNSDVQLTAVSGGEFSLRVGGAHYKLKTRLLGWHNAINTAAVSALLYGEESTIDMEPFKGISAPYGRGEVVVYNGCELTLQLVKNPAGFRMAMDVLPNSPALIVINDAYADSRDVSWLWDVDVSMLTGRPFVSVSGTRAYDMAVRLKYDDIYSEDVGTDIVKSLDRFRGKTDKGVVFLTYTAMLKVRTLIQKGSV